jgi:N-terminal half of MaoC dehydratase
MLIDLNTDLTSIKFKAGQITRTVLDDFNRAISAQYALGAAPTFATTLRKGEFEFLDRLKVNLKNLLHTDQTYEYQSPFCLGDIPEVETKLSSAKERRGMVFVNLESEVRVKGELRVRCQSSFILRETVKG